MMMMTCVRRRVPTFALLPAWPRPLRTCLGVSLALEEGVLCVYMCVYGERV